MKDAILKRLREPSTYAGLAALVGSLGFAFAPEAGQSILAVGTAVAALLAIWLPEKKS
ncbi:hypothetical protein [Rhizobium sp. 18065]|uniref:hypothetical protein n=1 Tax=Rhizobium sp. 18065 TaxID=2681411 RepID=UPI00190F1EAA|nr:hypothetical protein [Rhizobium sp. 18065]